jgi:hypothetical protein
MDRRDSDFTHNWFQRFDAQRMVLTIEGIGEDGEDLDLPAKFEVCDTCNGKGSHVAAGIDSHGLSREDFDEDPDFAEDYFRGAYDVPCVECHGRRVMPELDRDQCSPDLLARVDAHIDEWADCRACEAAERRMGY